MIGWPLLAMLAVAALVLLVGSVLLLVGLARLAAAERWRHRARRDRASSTADGH